MGCMSSSSSSTSSLLQSCCQQFRRRSNIKSPPIELPPPETGIPPPPSTMQCDDSAPPMATETIAPEPNSETEMKSLIRSLRQTFRHFHTGQIIGSGGFGIVNEIIVWEHTANTVTDADGGWVVLRATLESPLPQPQPQPQGQGECSALPPGARVLGHFAMKTLCKHDVLQRPTGLANLRLELAILIRLREQSYTHPLTRGGRGQTPPGCGNPTCAQCGGLSNDDKAAGTTTAPSATATGVVTAAAVESTGNAPAAPCLLVPICGAAFICHMHCAFQDARFVYMVLDLAERGDMRQYLNYIAASNHARNTSRAAIGVAQLGQLVGSGASSSTATLTLVGLAEQQVQFVVAQLILAVGYCHSRGIIHRDVKPENMLIDRQGYLSLTDYGIAKEPAPDIDSCRSTSGTHGYMAPEIYANKHIHGRPADWFAVGVTAYELLTRERPYSSQLLRSYKRPQLYTHFPPLPELFTPTAGHSRSNYTNGYYTPSSGAGECAAPIPAEAITWQCRDFIRRCLAADPTARLGSRGSGQGAVAGGGGCAWPEAADHMQLIQHPWFHLASTRSASASGTTGTSSSSKVPADFDWEALVRHTLPSELYPSAQPDSSQAAPRSHKRALEAHLPPPAATTTTATAPASRMLFPHQAAPLTGPVDLSHYSKLRVIADNYRRSAKDVSAQAQLEFRDWDYNMQLLFRPPRPASTTESDGDTGREEQQEQEEEQCYITADETAASGEARMRALFGLNSPPASALLAATPLPEPWPNPPPLLSFYNHQRTGSDPVPHSHRQSQSRFRAGDRASPSGPGQQADTPLKRKYPAVERDSQPPRTPPGARRQSPPPPPQAAASRVHPASSARADTRLPQQHQQLPQPSPPATLEIFIPQRDEKRDAAEKIPSAALRRHLQGSSVSA